MSLAIPLLRAGRSYHSLDTEILRDVRNGEEVARVSQAHPGLIARDLRDAAENRRALEKLPVSELLAICRRAGELFAKVALPIDPAGLEASPTQREGTAAFQSPEDYLRQLATTTGMPISLGRLNLAKIENVLTNLPAMLDGLTRGLDLEVLDGGWGRQAGRLLSFQRRSDNLGAVLPNNSPGVHNLWVPAIALKTPLVLKPGSSEPWTPLRLANAFLAAGCPAAAWSFYPGRHAAATEILLKTGRSLFFGDAATVASWRGSGKVQVHGPGWSKLLLDDEAAANWPAYLEVLASSVTANGGRSCINASSIWLPRQGGELAAALAEKLARIPALPLFDPAAQLAATADPQVAAGISAHIDDLLQEPGARDLTAELRPEGRLATVDGCTFLLPTVIHVTDPTHPLAFAEFTFPFVAVVDCPSDRIFDAIGPTLIATVLSEDPSFRERAIACRNIDRLNLGALPTFSIGWDQPHEGNLFDHLFQQRAFQVVGDAGRLARSA